MRKHSNNRYVFSIEIYDNEAKTPIVSESYNASHLSVIWKSLDKIMQKLITLGRMQDSK